MASLLISFIGLHLQLGGRSVDPPMRPEAKGQGYCELLSCCVRNFRNTWVLVNDVLARIWLLRASLRWIMLGGRLFPDQLRTQRRYAVDRKSWADLQPIPRDVGDAALSFYRNQNPTSFTGTP